MQSIFGKGSLYGVRATLRPDPDIMLGTSVDALAWLAKMGGPQASVTLLPTRKNSSAVCDWLAHISSGAGPMIPVGSPVAAPDEPAGSRAAVADQLLRMRMRQAWFGQNGGDFLVLEGERVALLLADAQLVREEYAADVHYAPTARISQQDVEAWILHAVHPSSRYMRALGDAASRYPDVFDTNVRLQLALQIRQGAAAGASGQIKPT
jgi:hypothetical protein